jgi:hypothetical protein
MRTKIRESEQLPWPAALGWWNPVMGAHAAYNAKLHETFLAVSDEWQTFLGRRIEQDLHLMRQISAAKTPEQMWTISTKFWQKAVEDYTREYGVIAGLVGGGVTRGVSAAQEAPPAAGDPVPPFSKAA